eukprot:733667-Prorocentrum_minimum.AAC.2
MSEQAKQSPEAKRIQLVSHRVFFQRTFSYQVIPKMRVETMSSGNPMQSLEQEIHDCKSDEPTVSVRGLRNYGIVDKIDEQVFRHDTTRAGAGELLKRVCRISDGSTFQTFPDGNSYRARLRSEFRVTRGERVLPMHIIPRSTDQL